MTKAEIVNEIAVNTGVDKVVAMQVVEGFMEAVKKSLSKDESVFLRGFGSFQVKKRAEKVARNISKGTTIRVAAHGIPSFKPAQTFEDLVKDLKK